MKLLGCIPINGRDLIEPAQDRTSEYYKEIFRIGKQLRLTEGIMVNTLMELDGIDKSPLAFLPKVFVERAKGQGLMVPS